ncbi:MAG: class I SAM-dependent methyltransferase [Candidatus Acidiferrales bacterium]
MPSKPDYGIDAPTVIRNLLLAGGAASALCLLVPGFQVGNVRVILYPGLIWTGASLIVPAVLMIIYAKVGKFRHRDRILDCVQWTGNERVLDVGTGRGLLLAGAAKKLTTGQAVGIDIWNQEDLSGNNMQNLVRNLELEGVREKTEVKNEDAQKMSFPDASFDVVLSNVCLHNIYNKPGRAQACGEIARVLKPSGIAVISDFRHMSEYRDSFSKLGMQVRRMPLTFDTFPPLRILTAHKQA